MQHRDLFSMWVGYEISGPRAEVAALHLCFCARPIEPYHPPGPASITTQALRTPPKERSICIRPFLIALKLGAMRAITSTTVSVHLRAGVGDAGIRWLGSTDLGCIHVAHMVHIS